MANDREWAAHLEEYKNLTDEIKRRVNYQLLIVGGNITFTAAVIGALADKFDAKHLTMILLLPLVSFVIVWLFFEQDVFVTQPARYIHRELRTAMIRCIDADPQNRPVDIAKVMQWEEYRTSLLFGHDSPYSDFFKLMKFFRVVATVGPGAALLAGGFYVIWADPAAFGKLTGLHFALFALDSFGVIFSFAVYYRVERYYQSIAG
jgi:hypothetical protein